MYGRRMQHIDKECNRLKNQTSPKITQLISNLLHLLRLQIMPGAMGRQALHQGAWIGGSHTESMGLRFTN